MDKQNVLAADYSTTDPVSLLSKKAVMTPPYIFISLF